MRFHHTFGILVEFFFVSVILALMRRKHFIGALSAYAYFTIIFIRMMIQLVADSWGLVAAFPSDELIIQGIEACVFLIALSVAYKSLMCMIEFRNSA